jgi:hypothetical protein
MIML